jgi:hypothetical protein
MHRLWLVGRNAIEAKFGQRKSVYGLQKIKVRVKATSESWILSIYLYNELGKTV